MIQQIIIGCSVGIVGAAILGLLLRALVLRCRKKKKAEERAASRGSPTSEACATPSGTISTSTPRSTSVPTSGSAVSSPAGSVETDLVASTEMLESTTKDKLKASMQQVELSLKLAEREQNPEVKKALLDAAQSTFLKAQNTTVDLKLLHCSKARLASRSVGVLSERPCEVRIPMNDLAGGIPLMQASSAYVHPSQNVNNHPLAAQVHQTYVNKSVADLASYSNAQLMQAQQNFCPPPVLPNTQNQGPLQPGFRPEVLQMMQAQAAHNLVPAYLQGHPVPVMLQQHMLHLQNPQQILPPQHVTPTHGSDVKKNSENNSNQETGLNSHARLVQTEGNPQRPVDVAVQSANAEMIQPKPQPILVPASGNESCTYTTPPPCTSQQASIVNNSISNVTLQAGTEARCVMNTNPELHKNFITEILKKMSTASTVGEINGEGSSQKTVITDEMQAREYMSSELSSEDSESETSEESYSDSGDSYELPHEHDPRSISGAEIHDVELETSGTSESSANVTVIDSRIAFLKKIQDCKGEKSLAPDHKNSEEDLLGTLKRKLCSLKEEEIEEPVNSNESYHSSKTSSVETPKEVMNSSKTSNSFSAHKRSYRKANVKKSGRHFLSSSSSSSSIEEPRKSSRSKREDGSRLQMQSINRSQPHLIYESNDTIGAKQRKDAESVISAPKVGEKPSSSTAPKTERTKSSPKIESQIESLDQTLLTPNQPSPSISHESSAQTEMNRSRAPASTSQRYPTPSPISSHRRGSEPASEEVDLMDSDTVAHSLQGSAVAFLPVPEIVRHHMRETGVDESRYCLPAVGNMN